MEGYGWKDEDKDADVVSFDAVSCSDLTNVIAWFQIQLCILIR